MVVAGGLLVVVAGGLVVVVNGAPPEMGPVVVVVVVVVLVVGVVTGVGVVAGVGVDEGPGGGAEPPGCSLATVMPRNAEAPPARTIAVLVRRLMRAWALERAPGEKCSTVRPSVRIETGPPPQPEGGIRPVGISLVVDTCFGGIPRQPSGGRRRCRRVTAFVDPEDTLLFIEYDVSAEGAIEVVALINAMEENGEDTDGADWMAWRAAAFDDNGLGCVGVPASQLALMEATEDADDLRTIVEQVILADRATKEGGRS